MAEEPDITDTKQASRPAKAANLGHSSAGGERSLRFDAFTALTYGLFGAAVLCQVILLAVMG